MKLKKKGKNTRHLCTVYMHRRVALTYITSLVSASPQAALQYPYAEANEEGGEKTPSPNCPRDQTMIHTIPLPPPLANQLIY